MALKQSENSINVYEGFKQSYGGTAMYNTLGGDKGLSDAIASNNDGYMNSFLSAVMDADKLNIDSFKSEYGTAFLNNNEKLTAAVNELYGDRTTQNEYTRYQKDDNGDYVFDDDGNPIEETYYDTEYNYTKSALIERANKAYEEYQQQCLQETKDGWTGWRKFWSAIGSTVMNLGASILDTIKDDLAFITLGIGSIFDKGLLQSYMSGDMAGGAGVFSDLMADFDTQYTVLRSADGSTTTVGNMLYGVTNTFGVMIPSMLTNLIPVAGAAGSIGSVLGNVAKQSVYWFSLGVGNIKDYMAASPDASFGQIVATSFGVAACQAAVTYINSFMFGSTVLEKATLGLNTSGGGLFDSIKAGLQGSKAGKFFNSGIGRFVTDFVIEASKQWYEEEWQERCQAIVESFSSYCNNNFNQIFELSGEQYWNAMSMSFLTSFISMGFNYMGQAIKKVDDFSQPLLKNGDIVYNKNVLDENGNVITDRLNEANVKYKKMSLARSQDFKQKVLTPMFDNARKAQELIKKGTVDGEFNIINLSEKDKYKLNIYITATANAAEILGEFYSVAGDENIKQGIDLLDKINAYDMRLRDIANNGGYVVYISQMLNDVYAGAELKALTDKKVAGVMAQQRMTQLHCIIDPTYMAKQLANELSDQLQKATEQETQKRAEAAARGEDPEFLIEAAQNMLPTYETNAKEAQDIFDAAEKYLNDLKTDIKKQEAIRNKANKNAKSAKTDETRAKNEAKAKEAQQKIDELTSQLAEAQSAYDSANIINKQAQLALHNTQQVINDAKAQIIVDQAKEQAKQEIVDRQQEADKNCNSISDDIQDILDEIEDKKTDIASLQEYIRSREAAKNNRTKIKTKDIGYNDYRKEGRAIDKQIANARESIKNIQTEIASLQNDLASARERLMQEQQNRTNAQADLNGTTFNKRVAELAHEKVRTNTQETQAPTEAEINKVNTDLDNINDGIKANDRLLKDRRAQRERLIEDTDALKKSVRERLESDFKAKSIEQRQAEIAKELNQVESDLKVEQAKTQGLEEQAKQKLQNAQNTEIDNAKAEQTRLNNELTAAKNQTQSIRDEARQRLQEAGPTEKELKKAEAKQAKEQNKLDKQNNREIKSLKSQRDKAIEAFNKEHAQKVNDLETARDNEIKATNDRIAENEKQIADIQQQIVTDQADIDTRTEENKRLEEELKKGNQNNAVNDILNDVLKSVHGHSDLTDAVNRVIAATTNSNMPILAALTVLNTELNKLAQNNDRNNGWSFHTKSIYEMIPKDYKTLTTEQRHNDYTYKYAIKDDTRASDIFELYGNLVNNISVNDPIWKLYDALLDYTAKRNPSNTDPTTPYNVERARYAPLTSARKSIESLIDIEQIRTDKIAAWNYNKSSNFYKNHKREDMHLYTEDIETALQKDYKYYTHQSNTSTPVMSEAERINKQGIINTNDLIIKGKTDSIIKSKQSLELLEQTNATEKNTIPNIKSSYAKQIKELNDTDTSESINADYDNRITAVENRIISAPETHERVITEKDIDNDNAVKANQEEISNLEKQLKGITIPETKEITDADIQNDEVVKANKAEIERLRARQSELLDEQEGKVSYNTTVTDEDIAQDKDVIANNKQLKVLDKEIESLEAKAKELDEKKTTFEEKQKSMTPEVRATVNAQAMEEFDSFMTEYLADNNITDQLEEPIDESELNLDEETEGEEQISLFDDGTEKSINNIDPNTGEVIPDINKKRNSDIARGRQAVMRRYLKQSQSASEFSNFNKIFNDRFNIDLSEQNKIKVEYIQKHLPNDAIVVITDDGRDATFAVTEENGKKRCALFVPINKLEDTETTDVAKILRDATQQNILYTIATSEVTKPYISKFVMLFDGIYGDAVDRVSDYNILGDAAELDAQVNVVANLLYNPEFIEQALIQYGEEVLQFIGALPRIMERMDIQEWQKDIHNYACKAVKDNIKNTIITFLVDYYGMTNAGMNNHTDNTIDRNNITLLTIAHDLSILSDKDYFDIINKYEAITKAQEQQMVDEFTKFFDNELLYDLDMSPDERRAKFTSDDVEKMYDLLGRIADYADWYSLNYNNKAAKSGALRTIIYELGLFINGDKTVLEPHIRLTDPVKFFESYSHWAGNGAAGYGKLYDFYNTQEFYDIMADKDAIAKYARHLTNLDKIKTRDDISYVPMFDTMPNVYLHSHSIPANAFNQMLRQYGLTTHDIQMLYADFLGSTKQTTYVQDNIVKKANIALKQQLQAHDIIIWTQANAQNVREMLEELYTERTKYSYTYDSYKGTIDFTDQYANSESVMITSLLYGEAPNYSDNDRFVTHTGLEDININNKKVNKLQQTVDALINPNLPADIRAYVTIEDIILNPNEFLADEYKQDLIESRQQALNNNLLQNNTENITPEMMRFNTLRYITDSSIIYSPFYYDGRRRHMYDKNGHIVDDTVINMAKNINVESILNELHELHDYLAWYEKNASRPTSGKFSKTRDRFEFMEDYFNRIFNIEFTGRGTVDEKVKLIAFINWDYRDTTHYGDIVNGDIFSLHQQTVLNALNDIKAIELYVGGGSHLINDMTKSISEQTESKAIEVPTLPTDIGTYDVLKYLQKHLADYNIDLAQNQGRIIVNNMTSILDSISPDIVSKLYKYIYFPIAHKVSSGYLMHMALRDNFDFGSFMRLLTDSDDFDAHNFTNIPQISNGTDIAAFKFSLSDIFRKDSLYYNLLKDIPVYFVPNTRSLLNAGYSSTTTDPKYYLSAAQLHANEEYISSHSDERAHVPSNIDFRDSYIIVHSEISLNIIFHETAHLLQHLFSYGKSSFYSVGSVIFKQLLKEAYGDIYKVRDAIKNNKYNLKLKDMGANKAYYDELVRLVGDFVYHAQLETIDFDTYTALNLNDWNTDEKIVDVLARVQGDYSQLSDYERALIINAATGILYRHSFVERGSQQDFYDDVYSTDIIRTSMIGNDSFAFKIYSPWGETYTFDLNNAVGTILFSTYMSLKDRQESEYSLNVSVNAQKTFDNITATTNTVTAYNREEIVKAYIENINKAQGTTKSLNNYHNQTQTKANDNGPNGTKTESLKSLHDQINTAIRNIKGTNKDITDQMQTIYDAVSAIHNGIRTGNNTYTNDYSIATKLSQLFAQRQISDADINATIGIGTQLYDVIHQYMYRAACGEHPSMTYSEFLDTRVPYYLTTMPRKGETFDPNVGPKVASYYQGGVVQLDDNISLDRILNTQYNRDNFRTAQGKLVIGKVRIGDILCANADGISFININNIKNRTWVNVFNGEAPTETGEDYIVITPNDNNTPNDNTSNDTILVHNADGTSIPMSIKTFKMNGRYVNFNRNIISDKIIFDTAHNKAYVLYNENDETGEYITKIIEEPIIDNSHFITEPELQKIIDKQDNIDLSAGLKNKGQLVKVANEIIRDPNTDIIIKRKLEEALNSYPELEYHVESQPTITTLDQARINVDGHTINQVQFVKQQEEILLRDGVDNKTYSPRNMIWFTEQHPELQEQTDNTSRKIPDEALQQPETSNQPETQQVNTMEEFYDKVDDSDITNTLSDEGLADFINMSDKAFADAISHMSARNFNTLRSQLEIYLYKMLSDQSMQTSIAFQQAKMKALLLATRAYRTSDYTYLMPLSDSFSEFYKYEDNKYTTKRNAGDNINNIIDNYFSTRGNNKDMYAFAHSIETSSVGELQQKYHALVSMDVINDYIEWCLTKDVNTNVDLLLANIMQLHNIIDNDCAFILTTLLSYARRDNFIHTTDTNLINYIVLSHADKITTVDAMSLPDILEIRDHLDTYLNDENAANYDNTLATDLYNVINAEVTKREAVRLSFIHDIVDGDEKKVKQFIKDNKYNESNREAWLTLIGGKNFGNGIRANGTSLREQVKGSYSATDLKGLGIIADGKNPTLSQTLLNTIFNGTDVLLPMNADDAPSYSDLAEIEKIKGSTLYAAEHTDTAYGKTISYAPIINALMDYTPGQLNSIANDMWTQIYTLVMGEKPSGIFTLDEYRRFRNTLLQNQQDYAKNKKARRDAATKRADITRRQKNDPNYTADKAKADAQAITDVDAISNIVAIYNTLYVPTFKAIAAYQAYLMAFNSKCTLSMTNIMSDMYSIMFAPKLMQYDYFYQNVNESDYGLYKVMIRDARAQISKYIITDKAGTGLIDNALSSLEDTIDSLIKDTQSKLDETSNLHSYYQSILDNKQDTTDINSKYNAITTQLTTHDLSNIESKPFTAKEIAPAYKMTRKERAQTRLEFLKGLKSVKVAGTNQDYMLTNRAVPFTKGVNTNIEKLGFFRTGTICEMSLAMQGFIVSSDLDRLSPIVVDTIKQVNATTPKQIRTGKINQGYTQFNSSHIADLVMNHLDELNDYTFQQINKYFYQNKNISNLNEYKALIEESESAWIIDTIIRYLKNPSDNNTYIINDQVYIKNPNILDDVFTPNMAYDYETVKRVLGIISATPSLNTLYDIAYALAQAYKYTYNEERNKAYERKLININKGPLGIIILNNYQGDFGTLAACFSTQRYVETSMYWNHTKSEGNTAGEQWSWMGTVAFKKAYANTVSFNSDDTEHETNDINIGDHTEDIVLDMITNITGEVSAMLNDINTGKDSEQRKRIYEYYDNRAPAEFIHALKDKTKSRDQIRKELVTVMHNADVRVKDFEGYLSNEYLDFAIKYFNDNGKLPSKLADLIHMQVVEKIYDMTQQQVNKEYLSIIGVNPLDTTIAETAENKTAFNDVIKKTEVNRQSLRQSVKNKIVKLIQGYTGNGAALDELYKTMPEAFIKDGKNYKLSTSATNRMSIEDLTALSDKLDTAIDEMKAEARAQVLGIQNEKLKQDLTAEKAKSKEQKSTITKQGKTILKQEQTIASQRAEIERQSRLISEADVKIRELIVKGQSRSFVFGLRETDTVKVPDSLRRIFGNTISGLDVTPANVQLGQAGGEYLSHNIQNFFKQNTGIFATMTQADWEEIIEYFCSEMGNIPITSDIDAQTMYMIYRVWLLAYAQLNAKDGLFMFNTDLNNRLNQALAFDTKTQSTLNQTIEGFGTQAGRYLNAFKQATDLLDPRRDIVNQIATILGVTPTILYDANGEPANIKKAHIAKGILNAEGKRASNIQMMAAETGYELHEGTNPVYGSLEDAINLVGDIVTAKIGQTANLDYLLNHGLDFDTLHNAFGITEENRVITITAENKPILLGIAIQYTAALDLVQHENREGNSAIDKVFAWEQMCMLSWPGTWIRNWTSNIILQSTNKIADAIGAWFGKGKHTQELLDRIDKFVNDPKAGYNATHSNAPMDYYMYQIQGTKAPDDIKEAVRSMLNDTMLVNPNTGKTTNFWNLLSSSSSRYSDMQRTAKGQNTNLGDKMVRLIVNSLTRKVMSQNKFSTPEEKTYTDKNGQKVTKTKSHAKEQYEKVLNMTSNVLFKCLSDEPWIKSTTTHIFEKMLTERHIKPENINYMNDVVISMFAEAYTEASWEYMHKASPMHSLDKAIRQKLGKGGWFVYKQMMPFANATWNWGMEALNYSPVGLIRGIYQLCNLDKKFVNTVEHLEMFEEVPSQNFTLYNARKMLGKGILGTLLMGMGAMAAAFGIIGLDKEDDKIKIKIGDSTYIDITSLFGTSSFLAGAGMVYTLCNSDEDMNKRIWSAINTVFDSLLEDSIFNSLFQSFEYSTTIGDWVSYNLVNSITAFIPNLWKKAIEGSYDFEIQYNSGFLGQLEKMGTKVIPGLAYAMPKKYDIYTGEAKSTYKIPFLFKWLNNLSPIDIEPYRISDIEAIALSLGINKGLLTGQYEDIGTLTIKQKATLNEMYGKLNAQTLNDLINNKTSMKVQNEDGTYSTLKWRKMTDAQKASAINSLMSKNATYAKAYVYTSYMGGKYYATDSEYTMLRKYGITRNVFLANDRYSGFV